MTRLLLSLGVALAALCLLPLALALAVLTTVTAPNPARAPAPPDADVGPVLAWAERHVGDRYHLGANGPHVWDCSSFTQAAYAQAGIQLPRIAQQQRDWLAAGHGQPISRGREQPGDLIFWDSYLGPRTIGHVVLVDDPARRRTVEAHNTHAGVGHFIYNPSGHRIYEIWRPRAHRV